MQQEKVEFSASFDEIDPPPSFFGTAARPKTEELVSGCLRERDALKRRNAPRPLFRSPSSLLLYLLLPSTPKLLLQTLRNLRHQNQSHSNELTFIDASLLAELSAI